MSYSIKQKLEVLSERSNILLIGLTGGIATGKSTVADFLKGMGAEVIDFDQLARIVVKPGKPAFNEITDIFGGEILDSQGNLDRKKLSDIVFRNAEKRKKLEEITHSRIADEFVIRVTEIADSRPGTIIIAAIPLLIEADMQDWFHKIVVVRISREEQIERLIKRDGVSREKGKDILDSQMPIDEKLEYADFIIHNDKSIHETNHQSEELWEKLKYLQRRKNRINP